MKSAMKIKFDENSGIMKIGYQDTDPVLATEVVNAVTDQLQTEFKRLTVDKTVSKRLYLEEAIAECRERSYRRVRRADRLSEQVRHL